MLLLSDISIQIPPDKQNQRDACITEGIPDPVDWRPLLEAALKHLEEKELITITIADSALTDVETANLQSEVPKSSFYSGQ
ncbi:unnamed protein product [Protopolystoma xenopodis]|uniref:Uncharacterized protein n=1 Tax=Protopolystoma xenopodis TaxID=117903 RepID=A0A3S4ZV85_9PLAT|nr:unnamed protein product [Protopolystoma xenopodis]